MEIQLGSTSWLVRQQLKHQGLELSRVTVQFTSNESAYPVAMHGIRFIAERLVNTTCFESVDIDYLIQRSVGGLAVLLNEVENTVPCADDTSLVALASICRRTIDRLHRTFCDHRNGHIEEALEAIRNSNATLKEQTQ